MPRLFNARHADAADLAQCKALLKGGSRSFHAASRILPASLHQPAGAVYAFCRLADDEIDNAIDNDAAPGSGAHGDAKAALERLRRRLELAYAGSPSAHPVDRAFADVVKRHDVPRALPEALLEGFAWDAEGRRYETLSDVMAYAARVAGAVGAIMAVLMDRRESVTLARACDLGCAMQLSNIARDVGEDARAGRLYLPRDWMRAEGLDPEAFLADPVFSPALARVVLRLLDEAEALYRRADAGIAALPLACRPGIFAARRMYAEIGHTVRLKGGNSVESRAVVSGRRKLALLAQSVALSVVPHRRVTAQALPETQFLVDAVQDALPPHAALGRVGFTLSLFARLDQRDHEIGLRAARG